MRVYYSLYGQLLNKQRLYEGYKKVRKAKGAAGIDGQSLSDFALNLDGNLDQLLTELRDKSYRPQPVRRVEIPKDSGGIRLLGIPAVRDRIVQQVLADILTPIYDPHFHPSSYGYRPGRSAHDAIDKSTLFIRRYGRRHVVDMDLSKCFDRLDHGLILQSLRRRVSDGSILRLVERFLKSGVMVDGVLHTTELGSPQGGVISPLIANIYLDVFDQAMRKRNHRIVRYADDILILCSSRKAAEHALEVATQILEQELKLVINRDKTHIAHSDDGIAFLGVEIASNYTRIQTEKIKKLKLVLKVMTRRNGGRPLVEVIPKLNRVLRGFSQYFKVANCTQVFKALAGWLRRRLRSLQLKLWKKPGRLHRRLKQLGYKPPFKAVAMSKWNTSVSPLASQSMPNRWFEELGLFDLASVKTGVVSPNRAM